MKFVIKHIVGIKHTPETEHRSFLGKFDIQMHSLLCLVSQTDAQDKIGN